MTYYLGQMIGPELLKREFKEVCLQNLSMYFTSAEISKLIYSNEPPEIDRFNKMMTNTIGHYISKYIPKYIGNFSKAAISGEIIFGVNDFGQVEGIPFFGNLDVQMIQHMFRSAMSNSRGVQINYDGSLSYDNDIVTWYYRNLKIQIIKLGAKPDEDEHNMDRSLRLISQLEHQKNELQIKWSVFEREYRQWHNLLMRYNGKLTMYLIDPDLKKELIDYIIEDFGQNKSYDRSKLKDILEFFDQPNYVFESMVFSIETIEEIIKDQYSPIKWLIAYKDMRLQQIRKMKPQAPMVKPDADIYYRFANNVNNIRSQLLKSADLNFYIIRIVIPNMLDTYLEYRNSIIGKWMSRKRIDSPLGPCCL